ncbi:conserved membrane protein of unknown function [Petrocella atlantisensis]|uniref:DUF2975 domain-containing protein n=1 Tax=Petrocella atlantisensis TaxID=2173034 RepID=A0A3P7PAA8_9FIRM|nr:hypothetical protein [Petrocella atlantisensis]VDN47093.1 conserved membrane protein of unknown function [Petrocella atlantisensis]
MDKKRLVSVLIGEGFICIIAFFLMKDQAIGYDSIISFPFVQMGYFLRILSLNSPFGNVIAWVAYVLFCLAPLILLSIRIRKGIQKSEDLLLLLLSVLLFFGMYYMINPGFAEGILAPSTLKGSWKIGVSSVVYIVLIGYIIMRLLRRIQTGMTDRLLIDLEVMLITFAGISVLALTFALPFDIMGEMKAVEAANTMAGIDFSLTHYFILLRSIIKMIPLFYQIRIILAGYDLVQALKTERYSQSVVDKAVQLVSKCRQAIIVTVIASIFINLLQLIAGAKLIHSNYHIDIPLTSILIVIMTMLLAKYFAHSSKIKEEMDLFV